MAKTRANEREAVIEIGGQRLTHAQALTLRVALTHFHMWLNDGEAGSQVGEKLASNYRARASEVFELLGTSIREGGVEPRD